MHGASLIVVGIDPGVNGGLARLGDGEPRAIRMPKTLHDLQIAMASILAGADHVILERISPRPGQSVRSVKTSCIGFGRLEMAIAVSRVPLTMVSPQKWQKDLCCESGGDKKVTKQAAQIRYPAILKSVTHCTADALLIATWGFEKLMSKKMNTG